MNQNAEHTERTEPSLPVPTKHTERSAIAWIVRPRDAAERRGAVVLWWVLALLFCGPQHFLALPYFPLGLLALVPGFVVWLLPVESPSENCLVVLFVLAWIVYALLTTTLLVFSGRGGRRWRVLAWTLVVLLVINTIGCNLILNGEAGIE